MPHDGLSTKPAISVVSPERTTTLKAEKKRLEGIQDKLFAVLGLKMAVDKLKDIGYEVVVREDGGCTTIKVELKVNFDFKTGLIGGKEILAVAQVLQEQIDGIDAELKGAR